MMQAPMRIRAWPSIGVLGLEQRARRAEQDVEVEQHRPVFDVIQVMLDAPLDLLVGISLTTPAVDLGPTGDARLDAMAGEIAVDRLVVALLLGFGVDGVRSRTDQRKVADQHD